MDPLQQSLVALCLPKTLSGMTRGWAYGRLNVRFLIRLLITIRSRFTRRKRLEAENLILRQELAVLRRRSAARVRLWNIDRLLMVWLYRLYPSLLDAVIIVSRRP